VRVLSQRSDLRGAMRLGTHILMLAGSGGLVWRSGPWTLLPAMLLLGIERSDLFAPIHETIHLTAFRARRANAVVGWLVACPSLLNWHFYTAFDPRPSSPYPGSRARSRTRADATLDPGRQCRAQRWTITA
jgi:hypothetical protein